MPTFEIIRDSPKPRVIKMGGGAEVADSEPRAEAKPAPSEVAEAKPIQRDEARKALGLPIPETPPVIEPKRPRGRPKMADKKLDHESGGPETIRKDDAGEKGAIGSHGENAPAQEKVGDEGSGDKSGEGE